MRGVFIFVLALCLGANGLSADPLDFNSNGALVRWAGQITNTNPTIPGEIRYDGKILKLESPATASNKDGFVCTYRWAEEPALEVRTVHHLESKKWSRSIVIKSSQKLASDLTVSIESWPATLPSSTWLPLHDGTGAMMGTNKGAAYKFAGTLPIGELRTANLDTGIRKTPYGSPSLPRSGGEGRGEEALTAKTRDLASEKNTPLSGSLSARPSQAEREERQSDALSRYVPVRLSIPMVSIPAANGRSRLMLATDPYFSTLFTSNRIEWTYPAKAGLENGLETREVSVVAGENFVEQSVSDFFRVMLPDVKPGPAWLHDIALVDFDYLSDDGGGWFRDINALTAKLSKSERHQAFLCVHGCYDFLGRYSFNTATGKLDKEWTCFSSYEQARNAHPYGTIGGERVSMGFTNCHPRAMSLDEVHRRLRYARSRGFRAGIYFADGMNAGDGLPDFSPDRVLRWGGWQGADSKGKSYIQNPLNPKVHDFFVNYTKAMLDEYGPDIDALIWDETFLIPTGQLGTDAWPGYADRAMMRLVKEVTGIVDKYNRTHGRQIALMASDDIGALNDVDAPPYALVAHSTYQDSWCQPKAWSYGIFPNYPNVMWSCCWWPVTKWKWVEFGVRNYQAPVSLSNGWGDDTGFSEMTVDQQAKVIELFRWRKNKPTKLRWFEELPRER